MASLVFGIDLSSQRCVVASSSGDVQLNELGSMTTASLVSFKSSERLIGEAATHAASSNPRNTVQHLPYFLLDPSSLETKVLSTIPGPLPTFSFESDRADVQVEYSAPDSEESTSSFSIVQLNAMLLGKLWSQMQMKGADASTWVQLAVPSSFSSDAKERLVQAAYVAGMTNVGVVTQEQALARCYQTKHPLPAGQDSRKFMIVDMGHTSTSVSVVELTESGENVLASACDVNLGVQTFLSRLFVHFQEELKTSHGLSDLKMHSKPGFRLFQALLKLLKLLSTIPQASVSVENLIPDQDISISLSKEKLQQLCAGDSQAFQSLITSCLESTSTSKESITSVEIVGGGTRIPFVQDAIVHVFNQSSSLLGRMLDSTTSVAVGAAFLPSDESETITLSEEVKETLTTWQNLESKMQTQDTRIAAIANEKNAIEAFVYEMRGKRSGKFGDKIDMSVLEPILTQAEDWLYAEETDNATLEQVQEKRAEVDLQVKEACAAYFDAVQAHDEAFEKQLEEESKKHAEEGEKEDHDQRKLKKPERMRLVVKNKEEGNELFKDGNHQFAAARYVKALGHASKFFDLTSDDEEEVRKLKVSLHLNLAQCYLKMESYAKCVSNCSDVLNLDSSNVKAYYRRAVAYEAEKKLDLAKADVVQAKEMAPTDKAVLRLEERIKILQKREKEKEKKMWSKAFA